MWSRRASTPCSASASDDRARSASAAGLLVVAPRAGSARTRGRSRRRWPPAGRRCPAPARGTGRTRRPRCRTAASSSTPRSHARAFSSELAVRHGDAEQLLDAAQQAQGRLRRRRAAGVVRHGSPAARPSGCRRRRRRRLAPRRCRSGPRSATPRRRSGGSAASSSAVAVTGIGRVCGTSASSAPTVTIVVTPNRSAKLEQLDREGPPAHRRLDALRRGRRRGPGRSRWRRGPASSARSSRRRPSSSDDARAVDLEVVVVLGVEGRDDLGVPDLGEVVDRARGGLAGVVPALEGRDEHRVAQLRHVLELQHHVSFTVVAVASTPSA